MPHTRRDLLGRAAVGAGALLLGSALGRLTATEPVAPPAAPAGPPRRFVFMLQSQGMQSWAAKPNEIQREAQGVEQVVDEDLRQLTLPADLEPLSPFKDRLTIIQGLNGRHVSPYHGAPFGALGGYRKGLTPIGETIDAALASALPSIFPMLCFGVGNGTRDSGKPGPFPNTSYCSSAWGDNSPAPVLVHPAYAYQAIFGTAMEGEARADFEARGDLLAFMRDRYASKHAILGGDELRKMATTTTAYETLLERQGRLAAASDRLKRLAPRMDEKYTTEEEGAQLSSHCEMASASLIAGLTNVVTITSGLCTPGGFFRGFVPGKVVGLHQDMGHNKGGDSKELYTLMRQRHLAELAGIAKRLQAVPEGDGTMLDHTVLVYTSDSGEAHHSQGGDWPFILLGNLGGTLRSGRYIDYPLQGRTGNRSINALYLSLLHGAGAKREHFNLTGALKNVDRTGPLDELMAG
jgi:hypothetical protein